MTAGAPPRAWVEVRARIPVAVQEAVNGHLVSRGAAGIQEDYPGLSDLGDDGPIVGGDPRQWAGEAPENASGEVVLTAWLPSGDAPEVERDLLVALLGRLAVHPGAEGETEVSARVVEEQDWNAPWKELWRPTPVGERLLVCPSWLEPEPGETRRVLRIDPGMAFGTGTHFTTASCLARIETLLAARPRGESTRVLDVGCGTGILAIGALALGAARATGIDLDPEAVAEAGRNAARNGVEARFHATAEPLPEHPAPHELVLANLVAETLVELAPRLARAVAPGGALVTSGVLHARAPAVERALAGAGLRKVDDARDDAWVTQVWTR